MGWIVLDLGAQGPDVHRDRARVRADAPPDEIEELHAREDATAMADQRDEQVELSPRQEHILAVSRDLVGWDVDADAPRLEDLGGIVHVRKQ